jgi:chaperone BCS1
MTYEKTHESTVHKHTGGEIRYDKIYLDSEGGINHLNRFINMISEIDIPMRKDMELCRYTWGENCWMYNKTFRPRKLETIYFPQKQELIKDLDQFLNNKEQYDLYKNLDIPYKYIFLFYGIPGTGKTSMIQAMASYFGYHISVVKTVAEVDDTSLERMISHLRKKTFLVFEDIDSIVEQRTTSNKTQITYSGLLNMLDGIGNYDKLVVFITTNRIDCLESAFKRRVDKFVEFTYMRKKEIVEMYSNFFKDSQGTEALTFHEQVRRKKLTTNMLEKYFMYCLQKKVSPLEDLGVLDDYSAMTGEKQISHMFT